MLTLTKKICQDYAEAESLLFLLILTNKYPPINPTATMLAAIVV